MGQVIIKKISSGDVSMEYIMPKRQVPKNSSRENA